MVQLVKLPLGTPASHLKCPFRQIGVSGWNRTELKFECLGCCVLNISAPRGCQFPVRGLLAVLPARVGDQEVWVCGP